MPHNLNNTLKEFKLGTGGRGQYYSLPQLGKALGVKIERLPISIRLVLESVLRNCDGKKVTEEHVRQLAHWKPKADRVDEIPFVVARVVLQDFTGVPLLADLAAMRNVAEKMGKNPKKIEPLVPVDLVVDHSVQIDHFREKKALDLNMQLEFKRNNERYQFMKWGMQAFDTFGVVQPGFGIVHQVNLEYLARGVHKKDGVYYPDTLVGTDSHTTMINGIGVVGWGVGGIEAEAGMLGQPVYFLTPDVVGVELKGRLREGVTATDLVLTITEMLRREKVVGKFVEFCRRRHRQPDHAGPRHHRQYGARVRRHDGLFPGGREDHRLFQGHGPHRRGNRRVRGLLPRPGDVRRADGRRHRLQHHADARPGLGGAVAGRSQAPAGPHRDRQRLKSTFASLFSKPVAENGFNKRCRRPEPRVHQRRRREGEERRRADRRHHLVHEHLQPERAAGRRPAGQEGGGSRPERGAAHQDVAGPGQPRGHRIPDRHRPAARTWRSWASA